MSLFKKQVLINMYTPSGTFIRTMPNLNFVGFTKQLNGGLSECILKTDKVFDYSGTDLLLGNDVEIRIIDKDTVAQLSEGSKSVIVYRGYISLIEREVDGQSESVSIHLLGYYTLLALDILKNSTQTTLYSNSTTGLTATLASKNAADIGLMVRAIIDRYIAETVNPKISYDALDIPNTSTTGEYTFEQKTYREALDAMKALAPAGVFYYINEIGRVSFKTKPTTPTHRFVFGKHFKKVHVEHSLEKVRNFLLLWNGPAGSIYSHYQDDDSIATYGRRVQTENDYGIQSSGAASLLGTRFLADNKSPDVKVTCTIIDNNLDAAMGYDIESIQPGDTCSFYGFAPGFDDIFKDNMLITEVNYTMDSVEITVEIIKSSLLELQNKQSEIIKDISTGGLAIPTTYS